jgi:hypothetical protein
MRKASLLAPLVAAVLPAAACASREGAPVAPSTAAASPDPPVDPSTLAVPGPEAASCTSDATCMNHRCNSRFGKCAFPCASDADCVRGTSCFRGAVSTCQPKGFGQVGLER